MIEMSLLPSDFSHFYGQLTRSPGLGFAMLLEDGTILARYPPLANNVRLTTQAGFVGQIAAKPGGEFTTFIHRSMGPTTGSVFGDCRDFQSM